MGEKKPMFVDLDDGIFGTFVEAPEDRVERGLVYPVYVPLGSIFPKKIKYAQAVPAECVHTVMNHTDGAGVEKQVVIVYRGKTNNMISFIDNKNAKLVQTLKEENADLRMSAASAMQERESAFAGSSKFVQQVKELTKDKKQEDPFFPGQNIFENM